MNNLECCVTTCASNKDGYCCRYSIKVQGQSSVRSENTRCQSFTPKEHELSNSTHYSHPEPETDVYCTACHCIYNNDADHKCTADRVQISGDGAGTMSDTACDTFCCEDDCGCE